MKNLDLTVIIPSELLEPLSKVIQMGIQKSKISPKAKKDLAMWWEVEKELSLENQ